MCQQTHKSRANPKYQQKHNALYRPDQIKFVCALSWQGLPMRTLASAFLGNGGTSRAERPQGAQWDRSKRRQANATQRRASQVAEQRTRNAKRGAKPTRPKSDQTMVPAAPLDLTPTPRPESESQRHQGTAETDAKASWPWPWYVPSAQRGHRMVVGWWLRLVSGTCCWKLLTSRS